MKIQRYTDAIKQRSYKYINQRRGWKTDRKIVVIESDDWGSIRMPNRQVYDASLARGIRVDQCHYCKYDTLASVDDFSALFEVLLKHRDSNGKPPVITANTIMANPDFNKIKSDNYVNYHYELFIETLKHYPNRSFEMWQEGASLGIFYPQLHGREHLNIDRWLRTLRQGSSEILFAFENNFFGISKKISKENNPSFMAALDYDNEISKHLGNESVNEACRLFEAVMGYKSKSFIGPNYYWHDETEAILEKNGIRYIQGTVVQMLPRSKKYHHLGQINSLNQVYLTRNVLFEPAELKNKDWVGSALRQIDQAFKLKKPAIICTHRVAFIGSIFEKNRTVNLKLLDQLMTEILRRWPNVEFMHSAQLGDTIIGKQA